MESTKDTKLGGLQSAFTRRNLLKGTVALAAAANVPEAFGQQSTGAPRGTVWLYIGTYTNVASGGSGGNGEGIYLCELSLSTGKLTVLRLAAPGLPATMTNASTASPSTLAIDSTGKYLYAGNEIFSPHGSVSAYKINRMTGGLELLNAVNAMGAPAHVGVGGTSAGRYLFAAEYVGSIFEAFPILADGSLKPAVFQMKTLGNVGPTKATSAPPGSFAISAHEGPDGHPHQMETDPSNQWVVGSDAGQDRIYVWKLTVGATPPLTPAAVPFVNTPPGDGPRHFAFHPNGVWMYSIQEEGDTIIFWRFNPATGSLTNTQQVSSLPPGFVGTVFTSEIRVSADGRFVYGVNRLSDTICAFRIGQDGRLTQVSHASTLGDYPRVITIDPSGQFMVSLNQRADNVTTFKISREGERDDDKFSHGNEREDDDRSGDSKKGDGSLTFTGDYTAVGSPSGMVFLI